jgi:phage recombination protein Bet
MASQVPVRRKLAPGAAIDKVTEIKWVDKWRETEVALSVNMARQILSLPSKASDSEVLHFLYRCAGRGLDPIQGDAYCVKYDESKPASFIVGYHVFMRAAQANPGYGGFECWCVNGDGKRVPDGTETRENIAAAICEVHVKDRLPFKAVCRMVEFNKGMAQWKVMPVHMLTKCAIGNAHRLADPGLAGMYLAEEFVSAPGVEEVIEGEVVEPEMATPETTRAQEPPTATEAAEEAPAEPVTSPKRKLVNDAIRDGLKRVFGSLNKEAATWVNEQFGVDGIALLTEDQAAECVVRLTELKSLASEEPSETQKALGGLE